MRDHQPATLDKFFGLYQRGNAEDCPLDHLSDTENMHSSGSASFETRDGIGLSQNVLVPLKNVLRIYNYITQDKNTLLVLVSDGADGKIYHVVDSTTVLGPVLTIAGMEDFAFIPYAGRAYISPFKTYGTSPNTQEKGMQNQFLYVYLGDGSAARKAAGTGNGVGTLTPANGAAGHTDAGLHVFGVVGETNTGYLSPPVALKEFTTVAGLSVSFTNVPVFTGAFWSKRHIVASIVIPSFNGDKEGYQLFFIPGATINDNATTVLANQSFYDSDLLEDASHLFDNYAEIPAGAALSLYHNRLTLACTFTDISLILVSAVGEPEAIDQVDGLIVAPLDGNPITNTQELRDVFYVRKKSRTISYVDNDDVPSTWPLTVVDAGLGCPVHGVATVLDSGASSVDFHLVASYRGVELFNGRYADPELSWKVADFWAEIDKTLFRRIQIVNDSVNKIIYVALPNKKMVIGDYANGLDPKNIRWWPWKFDIECTTIALYNISQLIIGSEKRLLE